MRLVLKATLMLVSSGVVGCFISEQADQDDASRAPPAVDRPQVRTLAAGTPPAELFDTKGRRWSLRRVHSTWKTEPNDPPYPIDDSPSIANLSDEELAEGLRPVRLHGHGKYVGEYLLDISMPEQIIQARSGCESDRESSYALGEHRPDGCRPNRRYAECRRQSHRGDVG